MEIISDKCLPPMPLTSLRTEVLLHALPPGYKHVQNASVHTVAAIYLRIAHIAHEGPEDLPMCYVKGASLTHKTVFAKAEEGLVRKAVLFSLGLVPPAGPRSVLQSRPQLLNELVHYSKANQGKEGRLNLLLLLPYDTVPRPGHLMGDKQQGLEQPCLKEGSQRDAFSTYHTAEGKSRHQGEHFHPLLSAVKSRKTTQRQRSPS